LLAYRPIQHSVYLLQAAIMDADDETDDVKSAVSAAVIVNKVVSPGGRNLGFKAASGGIRGCVPIPIWMGGIAYSKHL
jgi:hypothetical protein